MVNTMTRAFPDGFLWGAASAPHQVEGSNVANDVWAMEHIPGGLYSEPSGDAIDFYHRYREDIATMAQLGLGALRFGVEWARVEPEPGLISTAELDHYVRVVDTCLEHNVVPMVTLHHFTSPRWILTRRGWKNSDTAQRFADHAYRVAERFGDRVAWYCTINEANTPFQVIGNGLLSPEMERHMQLFKKTYADQFGVPVDDFAPFLPWADTEEAAEVVVDAHRRGVDAVHAASSKALAGVTLSMQEQYAEPGGETEAAAVDEYLNRRWLRDAGTIGDFVGVQNYSRTRHDAQGRVVDTEHLTDTGLSMVPASLGAVVREAYELTGKPIVITEHGADLPTERDDERVQFIRDSLLGVADAIDDGVDVRGYIHWSLADNWEWVRGYGAHFGLFEVDRATQTRRARPSARMLGRIAQANAV